MFGVCAAVDVLVCGFFDFKKDFALDVNEVGDYAVVHDGVPAEDEGVVVDWCYGRCGRCSDVAEYCCG